MDGEWKKSRKWRQMLLQRTRGRMGTEGKKGKRVRRDEGRKEDDVTKDASEQFAKGVTRANRKGVLARWSLIIDSCFQGGNSMLEELWKMLLRPAKTFVKKNRMMWNKVWQTRPFTMKSSFYDEATGEMLDANLVMEVEAEELRRFW